MITITFPDGRSAQFEDQITLDHMRLIFDGRYSLKYRGDGQYDAKPVVRSAEKKQS